MFRTLKGPMWLSHIRCIGFAAYLASCGVEPMPNWDDGAGNLDATSQRDPAILAEPGSYDFHLATASTILRQLNSARYSGQPNVTPVALVLDGFEYRSGYGTGESSVVCDESGRIPKSGISGAEAERILIMVQQLVKDLPVTVSLADAMTRSGTKVVIGGLHQDMGCSAPGATEPAVAAVYDRENLKDDDLAFVFSDRMQSATDTAIYTAAAIGMTVGVDSRIDWTSNHIQFLTSSKNSTPPAGGGSMVGLTNLPPALSQTPGLGAISSVGGYLQGVQPDQLADISSLLPQVGQITPGGLGAASQFGGFDGLADLMTVVGLAGQAAGQQAQGQVDLSTLLQAYLDPTQLQNSGTNDLTSLLMAAGLAANGNTAGAVSAVAILSQMFAGTTNSSANLSQLPHFGQILGLTSLPNVESMFRAVMQQSQVINGNFNGQAAAALHTMLRLGALQSMGSFGSSTF